MSALTGVSRLDQIKEILFLLFLEYLLKVTFDKSKKV